MGGVVYLLCAATALACGILLARGYLRGRTRLLLWCSIFFLTLALENVILFIDREVVLSMELLIWRRSIALIGSMILVYGLVWEGISSGGRDGGTGWPR